MIILDTNIVSELMKPSPASEVQSWLLHLGDTPLATTAISISEIVYGLARLPEGQRKAALTSRFEEYVGAHSPLAVLPFDDIAAREAGRMRALRQAAGLNAQPSDMMIAGIAAATGAALATRNVKDFETLAIQIIDPWNASQA